MRMHTREPDAHGMWHTHTTRASEHLQRSVRTDVRIMALAGASTVKQ